MRDVFLAQADRIEERLEEGSFVAAGRDAAGRSAAGRTASKKRADEVLTADAIFDLSEALQETLDASQEQIEEALRVGFRTGSLRINQDQVYDADAPWTRQALRALNDQMRQVPQNTRRIINEVIASGQHDPSNSVEDIADDIPQRRRRMASGSGGPGQSGSVTRSRARRVAATSTTTAFEKAQDQAWREAGIEGASWLSQRDGRVSEGHFEADGQRRQLGQPYQVRRTFNKSKEALMHPGDPEGRASNVVECRCSRRPLLDLDTE